MTERIFAICLVKNEADVICECLRAAASWCDEIFVYDNGSDDGTWESVLGMASEIRNIVPFKRDPVQFRDSLRAEVFETLRMRSVNGDWWCRLDADEFYIDNPKEFLANVPGACDVVFSASFQYYFTEKDLARYEADPIAFEAGSVHRKCRFYRNNWSEPRFFRNHDSLTYHGRAWPSPLTSPFAKLIRLKHFQYRSPAQIARRLATRKPAMDVGIFMHERASNWQMSVVRGRERILPLPSPDSPCSWHARIAESRFLLFDADGTGPYKIDTRALARKFSLRM